MVNLLDHAFHFSRRATTKTVNSVDVISQWSGSGDSKGGGTPQVVAWGY